mgnify:CR=1 FL=1
MTFRDLKVKDVFETPEYRKVMEQYAAKLLKYPGVKLLYKKSCGEIFDKVVATKMIPEEDAKKVEAEINKLLGA